MSESTPRAIRAEAADAAIFGASASYGHLCFHACVDLRRRFEAAALERAVEAMVADFPVMGCRYELHGLRDRWLPVEGPTRDFVHVERLSGDLEAATRAWVLRELDPLRDRPVRVVSLEHGGGCRLLVSLLHIAVDGGGAMAVARALAGHLYGVPEPLPVERRRDMWQAFERLRGAHWIVLGAAMFAQVFRPLTVFAVPRRVRDFERTPSGDGEPCWRQVALTVEQTERLKARLKAQGATLNDGLLAALARVAVARSDRGPAAVTYTIDLRRYTQPPRLIATNISGIAIAVIDRDKAGDLDTAAQAMRAVTQRQSANLSGLSFSMMPALNSLWTPHALIRAILPPVMKLSVDPPFRRALMVTNVGRLDEGLAAFGDDIEAISIIGPCLRNSPLPPIAAVGFRGQLLLQIYGPPGLTPEALERYEVELREALELEG